MKERFFVYKNKYGELAPQPIFGREVIFFKVVNPPSDGKEGEEWECELLPTQTTQTGKKDKYGRDIVIKKIKFLKKVESEVVKYNSETRLWEVVTSCGRVLVNKENFPSDSVEFVFRAPFLIQIARFREYTQEVRSIWLRSLKDIPDDVTNEVRLQVIEWMDKINKIIKEKDKKITAINNEMAGIINKGKGLPADIVHEFITNGCKIVYQEKDPRNSALSFQVFDINGFKFDQDCKNSSGGAIENSKLKDKLRKIIEFTLNPNCETLFAIIGLSAKPENTTIAREVVNIERQGANSKGTVFTKYTNKEEALTKVKKEIDKHKICFTPQTIETRFENLISIEYVSEVVEKIQIECEIGEYDFSPYNYYSSKAVGTLTRTWKIKNFYISPDVHEQVRRVIEEYVEKN